MSARILSAKLGPLINEYNQVQRIINDSIELTTDSAAELAAFEETRGYADDQLKSMMLDYLDLQRNVAS